MRKHFPQLWQELRDMDNRTWRQFNKDYSVEQLEIMFQLEEERVSKGLSIGKTRDFRKELKKRFDEHKKKA